MTSEAFCTNERNQRSLSADGPLACVGPSALGAPRGLSRSRFEGFIPTILSATQAKPEVYRHGPDTSAARLFPLKETMCNLTNPLWICNPSRTCERVSEEL